jgi:hypothetical protein
MARISLAGHWKFRRLVRALAALAPPPDQLVGAQTLARGLLELLWEAGYAAVSDYVGTASEVAEIMHWRGDPAVLVTLLVDAAFLDVHAPGEYRIHDLWANAPRYAQQRWLQKYPGQDPPWRQPPPYRGETAALSAAQEAAQSADQSAALCAEMDAALSAAQSAAYPVQSSPVQGEEKAAPLARRGLSRMIPPEVRPLIALGYELVRLRKSFATEADCKETLKMLAARYGIPYDATTIAEALDTLKRAKAPLFVLPQSRPRGPS